MKYLDEFRDDKLFNNVISKIKDRLKGFNKELVFMEVCGTHTMSIFRSGLKALLPKGIRLISGPGCPVCVTSNTYLDRAIAYARKPDVIIVSFGDMIRVPGSSSSLEKERAKGADIRIVYSSLDALEIAKGNLTKKIIFLGVGFETTAPTVAATIKIAQQQNIKNFFVFSTHKLIPPAMKILVEVKDLHINGFICPGHVSTVIGSKPYGFISEDYNIHCVIAGFEPLDIVQSIYMLIEDIVDGQGPSVKIQYKRSVRKEGNPKALDAMREVFKETDSAWRGLGKIPDSGLIIKEKFRRFDVQANIKAKVEKTKENKDCICGDVLRGVKSPCDCKLFKKVCSPENPIGACMVSSEGTCAAYYKYEDLEENAG